MEPKDRIFVALDSKDLDEVVRWAKLLGGEVGGFKIGLRTVLRYGVDRLMEALRGCGPASENIFVDAKLHDIPSTMAEAAEVIVAHPSVKFFNVHASASYAGVQAVNAVKRHAKLLAVTVLTSMNDADAWVVYGQGDVAYHVARLAQVAYVDGEHGADGVICSAREAGLIKKMFGEKMLTMTPGIRPKWAAKNEQERVTTPAEAVTNGADYLVIGRPIIAPPEHIGPPVIASRLIALEIAEALANR